MFVFFNSSTFFKETKQVTAMTLMSFQSGNIFFRKDKQDSGLICLQEESNVKSFPVLGIIMWNCLLRVLQKKRREGMRGIQGVTMRLKRSSSSARLLQMVLLTQVPSFWKDTQFQKCINNTIIATFCRFFYGRRN